MSGVFCGEFHHFISSGYTLLPNQYFERHNIFGKDLECLEKCSNLWDHCNCTNSGVLYQFYFIILGGRREKRDKPFLGLSAIVEEHIFLFLSLFWKDNNQIKLFTWLIKMNIPLLSLLPCSSVHIQIIVTKSSLYRLFSCSPAKPQWFCSRRVPFL